MLIINSTKQICIPLENVAGIVVQPVSDPSANFYKTKGGENNNGLTDIIVTSVGGLITFTEHYSTRQKATEAIDALLATCWGNKPVAYQFGDDPEYAEMVKRAKAKKKAEAESSLPAYAKKEADDGQGY